MNFYNNFFYFAKFTLDEIGNQYAFYLYLIANTDIEFERFNIPSVDLPKDDKIALYMKFKLFLDKETKIDKSSIKLASLLYKNSFNDFISGFEHYKPCSEDIICKGKINKSCDLNDVMLEIINDVKNNLSNPLNLGKYTKNNYHNPHQSYKNRIKRGIAIANIPDMLESEINILRETNMDKSYIEYFDEITTSDKIFKKHPFYIASPHGLLKNIKLNDKLEVSLSNYKQTKILKI